MSALLRTVWVFGDQLNRNIGALQAAQPDTHRILIYMSGRELDNVVGNALAHGGAFAIVDLEALLLECKRKSAH